MLSYFQPLRFLPALLLLSPALPRLPRFGRFAGEGATDCSSVSGLSLSSRNSADERFLDVHTSKLRMIHAHSGTRLLVVREDGRIQSLVVEFRGCITPYEGLEMTHVFRVNLTNESVRDKSAQKNAHILRP